MDADGVSDIVCIELLGGFRVDVAGEIVPPSAWPSRRSAELVQLLALADGHQLLHDQVVEALWPHLPPDAGAANLRKAAHHARRALGRPDAAVLTGGRTALFPAHRVETDVGAFERRAAAALQSSDPAACAAAAACYAGELLPQARYAEWTQARREHLAARYRALLRAAGLWEQLVEADPADETAYRELMRAALAGGNRHEVIRWYGRLRAHLERELGLAPAPETAAIYEECLAEFDVASPAFVGRDLELARAEAALLATIRSEVDALVVRGPAGIGKSALCHRLEAAARAKGWGVATTVAGAGGRAYAPLADVVVQLLRRDSRVHRALPEQARGVLAALVGAAPAQGLTRHKVVGAVRRVLLALRDAPGVLIVLDDAHLADAATVEASGLVARTRAGPPVLVVLAFRPERAPPMLAREVGGLARTQRTVEIDLGPLDRADTRALVAAAAPPPHRPEEITRIVDLAQGNPFFALELARAGAAAAVPATVWEAVANRFLELDEVSFARLRRLAVAADALDLDGVLAVTGLPEPEAFAFLDTAIAAGALVVTGTRYRFRHEVLRTALVEQVPPHHRVAVHRDAARRLAASHTPPAVVARHWLDGGRPEEAVDWLMAAARQAHAVGAFADVLRHLAPLREHAPEHVGALLLRAEALDALGDPAAPPAYAAAAAASPSPQAEEIRARQALAQLKQGDPAGARQTLDGLAPATPHGRLARALALSGLAALGLGDPAAAATHAAESRALALRTRDLGSVVEASWAQALAAHARGELTASVLADLRDTRALPELAVRVFDGQLCVTQRLLYGGTPYPEVIAFADALAAEAVRLGAARGHSFAMTLRGEALLLSGHLDAAETDLAAAVRMNRAIGAASGEALALQRRAEVALHRGDRPSATALLEDALAVARESDVAFHVLDRIYGTRIAAVSSLASVEEAEAAVRGPIETCPTCRITLVVPAAVASAAAGDLDRAARHAAVARTLATAVMRLPGWDAAVEEVEGHLARARGDVADALARFRAAAEMFRAAGQPLDAARCAALAGGSA